MRKRLRSRRKCGRGGGIGRKEGNETSMKNNIAIIMYFVVVTDYDNYLTVTAILTITHTELLKT